MRIMHCGKRYVSPEYRLTTLRNSTDFFSAPYFVRKKQSRLLLKIT